MPAVTLLGTQLFDTNSGSHAVTATPAIGDLIVLICASTGNTAATAPTDNNADGLGTYSLAETAVKASSADTMKLWIRNALIGSATSTVFTHNPGTSSGGGLGVLKVTGMFRAGALAELKSGKQDNQAAATPAVSYTGGGAGLTANAKIGAVFNASSPAGMTKPTSFDTELFDVGYSVPTTGIEVVSDDSGNTDTTVTWGSASASAFCAAILELDSTASPLTVSLGPDSMQLWADSIAGGKYSLIRLGDSVAFQLPATGGATDIPVSLSDNLAAYADTLSVQLNFLAKPTTDAFAAYGETLLVSTQAPRLVQVSDALGSYADVLSARLTYAAQPGAGVSINGLEFPQNNGTAASTAMTAIKFANPQSNGLPIWGPSNAGVTVVRKIYPKAQNNADNNSRYVAMFWWSDGSNFNWNSGSPDSYWGIHPYPNPAPGGASGAYWEIAVESGDVVNNRNSSPVTVVNDAWYAQGMRVTRNSPTTTKTLVFYLNLPSTTNANVIEFTTGSSYGESNPPNPQLTIGDSPWHASYQHETFSGIQGPIKIFDIVLSEADMVSEASDFTRLVTSQGQAHIWWGKKSFATVDDLTCDYGTGRSWAWQDATKKATLADAGTTPPVENLANYSDTASVSTAVPKTASLSDSALFIADSLAGKATLSASPPAADDFNNWADSPAVFRTGVLAVAPAADTMVQADQVAVASLLSVAPAADSMTQADQVSFVPLGLSIGPATESMAQIDSLTGFQALAAQLSDNLSGYNDTVTISTGAQKFAALGPDNFANYADTTSNRQDLFAALTDAALFAADSLTPRLSLPYSLTDSALFVADTAASKADELVGLSENLAAYADQATFDLQSIGPTPITSSLTDNFAGYDDQPIAAEDLLARAGADNLASYGDSILAGGSGQLTLSFSDNLANYVDSVAGGVRQLFVGLADDLAAYSDSPVAFEPYFARPSTDNLAVYADAVTGSTAAARLVNLTDPLPLYGDSFAIAIGKIAALADNLANYGDQANAFVAFRAELSDFISQSDFVATSFTLSVVLPVDDVANYLDTVVTEFGFGIPADLIYVSVGLIYENTAELVLNYDNLQTIGLDNTDSQDLSLRRDDA